MSLAAGITARAAGQHDHGPARVQAAASTRSAGASRHDRAHVERRTGEEGDQAPPKTRFLIGLARPFRAVLRATARHAPDFGLRTRFERPANVSMRKGGIGFLDILLGLFCSVLVFLTWSMFFLHVMIM